MLIPPILPPQPYSNPYIHYVLYVIWKVIEVTYSWTDYFSPTGAVSAFGTAVVSVASWLGVVPTVGASVISVVGAGVDGFSAGTWEQASNNPMVLRTLFLIGHGLESGPAKGTSIALIIISLQVGQVTWVVPKQ